jgi:RAB protein geranylgeranyltransferase component A
MPDSYNTNSRVNNFMDFCNNLESEKQKLKKLQRSYTTNSDRQNFVRNSRTEYDTITHKLRDYTEQEIGDILDTLDNKEND